MESIFRSKETEKVFDDKGVVSVFFSNQDFIVALRVKFDLLLKKHGIQVKDEYFFSTFELSKSFKEDIQEVFLALLNPLLDELFINYKILAVIAQIKPNSKNSEIGIHQDLTVLDESLYRSITFWIPLTDSTMENGAIRVLEGSHKYFRSYRTHNMKDQFSRIKDFVKRDATSYACKAGEALAINASAIHFSPANLSSTNRYSIALSIVPKKASIELGYINENNFIDVYKVPDNFWLLYNNFNKERMGRPFFGVKVKTVNKEEDIEYSLKDYSLFERIVVDLK
jgi:hypothetical protein